MSFLLSYLAVISHKKVLLFASTCDEVEYLATLLEELSYEGGERIERRAVFKLHGNIPQAERAKIYFGFRKEEQAVLVSTDVAARGLDFPGLEMIILFDVPPTLVDYSNRVGRTARFNEGGRSLLLLHHCESSYAQQLDVLNKRALTQTFSEDVFGAMDQKLRDRGIDQLAGQWLRATLRRFVADDDEHYRRARRAYVSLLRAYARLTDKETFQVKKLNLHRLASGFGLGKVKSRGQDTNPRTNENADWASSRKRQRLMDFSKLQRS